MLETTLQTDILHCKTLMSILLLTILALIPVKMRIFHQNRKSEVFNCLQAASAICNCGGYSRCAIGEVVNSLDGLKNCHDSYCKQLLSPDVQEALNKCGDPAALIDTLKEEEDEAVCMVGDVCTTNDGSDDLDMMLSKVEDAMEKEIRKYLARLSGKRDADQYVDCMKSRCSKELDLNGIQDRCDQGGQCTIEQNMLKLYTAYKKCKVNISNVKKEAKKQCRCLKKELGFSEGC